MPTLRVTSFVQERKSLSLTGHLGGETATTADFALFDGLTTSPADRVGGLLSNGAGEDGVNDRMNDSTLSGSLLEEALDILRGGSKETQLLHSSLSVSAAKPQDDQGSSCPLPSQIQCDRETTIQECGPSTKDPGAVAAKNEEGLLPLSVTQGWTSMEEANDHDDVENGDDEYSCHSFDLPPPPVRSVRLQESGDAGPNERLYREKYAAFVSRQIQGASHALAAYRTMAIADKEREQERVLALLHRLSIRPLDGEPTKSQDEADGLSRNDVGEVENGGKARTPVTTVRDEMGSQSKGLCKTTTASQVTQGAAEQPSAGHSLASAEKVQMKNSNRASSRKSVSFALDMDEPLFPDHESDSQNSFSSSTGEPTSDPLGVEVKASQRATLYPIQPPLRQDSSFEEDDESLLSSDSEIEVARSKECGERGHGSYEYNSPTATTRGAETFRKRSATTSGKRGTDTSRTRSTDPPASFGLPLAASDQSRPFILSASPIAPYNRQDRKICSGSHGHHWAGHQDVSLGDSLSSESITPSKTATTQEEESILFTSSPSVVDEREPLRNASNHSDVRMKQGASFHLPPLETRPSRQENFPDPFHVYDGSKLLPRMLRVVGKLCRREESAASKPGSTARAIVLSMEMPHIHRLVLKLVLETAIAPNKTPPSVGLAKTLIVAREREDLEAWNRMLRECSSLRVLNHSTLPVVQRKTRSTADLCSSNDVVLTTYDCLKSADVTVQLDAQGYVLTNDNVSCAGEWVSSRTTSSEVDGVECKQLSVLHCLHWKRIVLLDTVGRKSFLSKPETGRSLASKSLNSNSRIMFFTDPRPRPDIDDINPLDSLVKSDRRAIGSVASILRASVDGSESDFLRHVVIDLHRRTTKHTKRCRPNA